ncbi:MAG: response regulator, partial [bacterium]
QMVERLLGTEKENFAIRIKNLEDLKKVIYERNSIFIEDIENSILQLLPEGLKKHAGQIIRVLNIPRTIVAPLVVEDKVIAVLFVQSNDLTKQDIPSITAFANQMAAAWHKATLMKNLQGSVHELKATQERLVQSQKMEAVGKLAGGIAHDFNNLLTIIQGYTELLLARTPRIDRSYNDILQVEKASKSAESLVRQLLAFSRKQIMQPKILNLNILLRNMEPMLERLVGEDIEFSLILAADSGQVKADPHQIEQVVMNLVVNSREALQKGGSIIIKTKNVAVADKTHIEAGEYVLLSVTDDGCGMDDNIRSRIFEPFFTTKTKGKGTGLGLSTVYGIIQQSEGAIEVESDKNKGTTFNIYLPKVKQKKATSRPKSTSVDDESKGYETILVVEDEKDVRNIICEVLRQKGYQVLEAENGENALDICKKHKNEIELLLTDVVMPKMSGAELVKKLPRRKKHWRVL